MSQLVFLSTACLLFLVIWLFLAAIAWIIFNPTITSGVARFLHLQAEWYGDLVSRIILVFAIICLLAGTYGLTIVDEGWLPSLAPELIGLAISIVVIDGLYRYRGEQQEEQRILKQIKSPSNLFAIEALRLAEERGILETGKLEGQDLAELDWQGAWLKKASLKRADLSRTNMSNCHFDETTLEEADLYLANLSSSVFHHAKLAGANLFLADLRNSHHLNSNFINADLRGARLQGSELVGVDFRGADLRNTSLFDTMIHDIRLEGAKYDDSTVWPIDFRPEDTGAIYVPANT